MRNIPLSSADAAHRHESLNNFFIAHSGKRFVLMSASSKCRAKSRIESILFCDNPTPRSVSSGILKTSAGDGKIFVGDNGGKASANGTRRIGSRLADRLLKKKAHATHRAHNAVNSARFE
jgi:hypothetical protein